MNRVVVALGSNIEPHKNVTEARKRLREAFKVIDESDFVETKPIGYDDQPDFLNGCVLMETSLDQEELRASLKEMEMTMGREASPIKCGPRTIDLDIVVFNGEIADQDFYKRDFLKQAVLQLIPALVH